MDMRCRWSIICGVFWVRTGVHVLGNGTGAKPKRLVTRAVQRLKLISKIGNCVLLDACQYGQPTCLI